MTVAPGDGDVIVLEGLCPSDDAEPLLRRLLSAPEAAVDWRACEGAHTAVVQVLLAARRPVRGPARNAFLTRWVEPLLGPR